MRSPWDPDQSGSFYCFTIPLKKTDGAEPPIVSSAVVSFLRTARPRVVSLSEPHDEEHPLGFEWSRRVTSHKLTHSCCEVRRKPQT